MSSLDDDIARVARLRGRDPATIDTRPRKLPLTREGVGRILAPNPHPAHDLEFYDRLPQASRDFIRSQARPLNAMWWWYLLRDTGQDETEVIKAVTFLLPSRRTPE